MVATRRSRGYTLLELAMVLALVSILLGAGATRIARALAREELEGWVRAMAYDVGAGQQAAITRRTTVTVGFQDQTFSVSAPDVTLRQETLPAHISLGPSLQVVMFDRRGRPSSGLTVTVTSARAGRSYAIVVEPGTGRVTVDGL